MDRSNSFFRLAGVPSPHRKGGGSKPEGALGHEEEAFAAEAADIFVKVQRLIASVEHPGREEVWDDGERGETELLLTISDVMAAVREVHEAVRQLEQRTKDTDKEDLGADLKAHQHSIVSLLYSKLGRLTERVQLQEALQLRQALEARKHFVGQPYLGPAVRIPAVIVAELPNHASLEFVPSSWKRRATDDEKDEEEEEGEADAGLLPPLSQHRDVDETRDEEVVGGRGLSWALPEEVAEKWRGDGIQLLLQAEQETDAEALRETQQQVHEVSQLMGAFAAKVAEQSELCDQIVDYAQEAVGHVTEAGGHLKKAIERSASYRFLMLVLFVGGGVSLLILDFFTSRRWY